MKSASEICPAVASCAPQRHDRVKLVLLCSVIALSALAYPRAVKAQTTDASGVETVTVTAEKRSEKLGDVPMSIGVLSPEALKNTNATSLTDFASLVPGLSIASGGTPGVGGIVIRGLATGANNSFNAPLVATYVDDLPIGGSAGGYGGSRGGFFTLDLMPYDIDQIEVLKGPQGTLYGADAMGGIVKYTMKKPDLENMEVQAGADSAIADHAGSPDGGVRAAVNVPIISDTLAVRVSGYYKDVAGWIDNLGTRKDDSNSSKTYGGRLSVLWQPIDSLSIELSAMMQGIHSDDVSAVMVDGVTGKPLYGDATHSTHFAEPFSQQASQYAMRVNWDAGFGTFTNSASYSYLRNTATDDLSTVPYVPAYPTALIKYTLTDHLKKYTEEARFASPEDQSLQWMAGFFYTREEPGEFNNFRAYSDVSTQLPPPNNILLLGINPGSANIYQEWAFFGNATYKVTDNFDVSGGLRYSRDGSHGCGYGDIGLYGHGGVYACQNRPYEGVTTWMANAGYHFDDGALLYARVATGYRPGGGCSTCGNTALQIPGTYEPDKLTDYEVGFRGDYLDRRLHLDLSAFYIDWKKIQLQVTNKLGLNYAGNGGTAVSKGFEATTSYVFDFGLTLGANAAYTDAYLTEDAPGVFGKKGDPLPESALWAVALTADYVQQIEGNTAWTLGADYHHKSKVYNMFRSSATPLPMGAQDIVDAYTGLDFGNSTLRLYVKNLFNNRSYDGLVYSGTYTNPLLVPVQPRTIGVSYDYKLEP